MRDELQQLVDRIADRVGRPALVEDRRQRVVCYSAQAEPLDEVRRSSILRRSTTPEVIAFFSRFDITRSHSPVRTPAAPALGLLPRVCVPVWHSDLLLGFVWFVDSPPLSSAELASAVAHSDELALALYRVNLLGELAARREADAVRGLLATDASVRAEAAALVVGEDLLDSDGPAVALVATDPDPAGLEQALVATRRWYGHRSAVHLARTSHGVVLLRLPATAPPSGLSGPRPSARPPSGRRVSAHPASGNPASGRPASGSIGDGARILGQDPDTIPDSAAILRSGAGSTAGGVGGGVVAAAEYLAGQIGGFVGVGDPVPTLADAATSVEQATQALRIAVQLPTAIGPTRVAVWSQLGVYRILAAADLTGVEVHPGLSRLSPSFVATLEAYLDLAGDAAATAAQLRVHRTTLYYRLARIEELTGADLRDGMQRLALHLAVKAAHLNK